MSSVTGLSNEVVSIAPVVLRTWIWPGVVESSITQSSATAVPSKETFAADPALIGSSPA